MVFKNYTDYLKEKEKLIEKYKGKFGCIVEFHGFVREYDLKESQKIPTTGLNIADTIFEKLENIENEAKERFEILDVLIYHNSGFLKVGEKISSISIFARHREEAFLALNYIINEMKKYH